MHNTLLTTAYTYAVLCLFATGELCISPKGENPLSVGRKSQKKNG